MRWLSQRQTGMGSTTGNGEALIEIHHWQAVVKAKNAKGCHVMAQHLKLDDELNP